MNDYAQCTASIPDDFVLRGFCTLEKGHEGAHWDPALLVEFENRN